MVIKYYFKLVRPLNLLFVGLIPAVFHYGFFIPLNFDHALNDWELILLSISLVLVAAAGYVVNDIHDQIADSVNKPQKQIIGKHIREGMAFGYFGFLAIAGLAAALWLAWRIDNTSYAYLHAVSLALLWLYAADFKGRIFLGNLIVSILAALNVFAVALFDLLPELNQENTHSQSIALYVVFVFSILAFWTTLIREIIKDAEDAVGDAKAGYNTVGTKWSANTARNIAWILMLVECAGLFVFAWIARSDVYSVLWTVLILMGTLVVSSAALMRQNPQVSHFHRASLWMKIHMLAGILSPLAFTAFVYWA